MSPFDLNLRHLRGILAVREAGSISAAAEVLNLSQPALTQGIVKLERSLGHALFERRPDGMVTTEAGHLVADRVRSAFEHLSAGAKMIVTGGMQVDRRLNMTHLRAFLAVVQAGSFAAGSAQVGLSQTAVHRGVRDLEAVLQKQLVERRGRGVHVNFIGRRFARSCRLAVGELQSAFLELGIDPLRKTISVGTTPLARAFLVPEAMAALLAEGQLVGFQVSEGNWGDLVELLRDGLIDLIVGDLPAHQSPDLSKIALCEESAVVVARHGHPLASAPCKVDAAALARYPWIVAPENSPLRDQWERLFPAHGRPSVPIECGSIMIVGRLLTSSDMLTLATPDQVALQIRSGLLARIPFPLKDGAHTIGITLRERWRPTAAQQRFMEVLADTARSIGSMGHCRPGIALDWNS